MEINSQSVEKLLQQLGNELLDKCNSDSDSALLYSEFQSGVVSPSIFFIGKDDSAAHYRFSGPLISQLANNLRSELESNTPYELSAIEYSVISGKPHLRCIWPDQFDAKASENQRRVQAVQSILGVFEIDYSHP